jgi:hypothetical protein
MQGWHCTPAIQKTTISVQQYQADHYGKNKDQQGMDAGTCE